MSGKQSSGFPFVKIVVILACTFGVGLGLCGLDGALLIMGSGPHGPNPSMGTLMGVIGIASALAMFLSAVGLLVTVIALVVSSAFGTGRGPKGS
jgi:hypothetical protein